MRKQLSMSLQSVMEWNTYCISSCLPHIRICVCVLSKLEKLHSTVFLLLFSFLLQLQPVYCADTWGKGKMTWANLYCPLLQTFLSSVWTEKLCRPLFSKSAIPRSFSSQQTRQTLYKNSKEEESDQRAFIASCPISFRGLNFFLDGYLKVYMYIIWVYYLYSRESKKLFKSFYSYYSYHYYTFCSLFIISKAQLTNL